MPGKKSAKTKTAQKPVKQDTAAGSLKRFPIAGLGASAGGLEALKSFFSAVPEKSGIAYIVIVHLAADQPSMMPELLQSKSSIPVETARNNQVIRPDHVYVMPPDREIWVKKGRIHLRAQNKKSPRLPIDPFLRSLADDQEDMAVAVIMSGTGSDGTLGIREIKAKDGLIIVQDEKSAAYDGMPKSAMDTGLVDMVMPPGEMPDRLMRYFSHSGVPVDDQSPATDEQNEWLNRIFAILKSRLGHDFSAYKINTTLRRIARRMSLNHITGFHTYARFLREHPHEVDDLFRELLIGVTNFFRDSESFDVLENNVLPDVIKEMNHDETFRAWVPGCSTGEEAYSIAIVLKECLDRTSKKINVQLFGTDIDDRAIDKAREGIYPSSISEDVGRERLNKFFTREGDFYHIRKEIRDMAVFSVQDVIKDPPFSRLNLLCCRNLLIYLNSSVQKKLLPLFHYTLVSNGIMMLGSSETIGGFSTLFKTMDKKWKIFKKRDLPRALQQMVEFPAGAARHEPPDKTLPAVAPGGKGQDIALLTRMLILDRFTPTAVLTDEKGNILHVQGRTGKYLETPSGPPTSNILDLAREGLRIELSSALREARSSSEKVTRQRIIVKTNGDSQMIDLHICPLKSPGELAGNYLIIFEDIDPDRYDTGNGKGPDDTVSGDSARISELERELQITRESHQTSIEELESTNEELKSTNEEMQSSNEELQSTNEELESSKEELQSLNEELQTVNAELQSKVEELSAAHDDIHNLLNSTEIATIFVDNEMRVRRFTPESVEIVNLIPADIGRPLKHVVSNLKYDGMLNDIKWVIKKLTPKEVEVETLGGNWFSMRIIPYRTIDNRIDGAVLTFASISDQKDIQRKLENTIAESEVSQKLVRAVFDMNYSPMAVLDKDGRIIIANSEFTSIFRIEQNDLDTTDLFKQKTGLLPSSVQSELAAASKENRDFLIEGVKLDTSLGKVVFNIKGRTVRLKQNQSARMLLAFESRK